MTKIIDLEIIITNIFFYGGGIGADELFRKWKNKPTRERGTGGYDKHIEMCKKLGLVVKKKERFEITDSGNEFLATIPAEGDNFRLGRKIEEQKEFLKKILKMRTNEIKEYFADAKSDVVYDNGERHILLKKDELKKIDASFSDLLEDADFLIEQRDEYIISNKIESKLPIPRNNPKITEDEFDDLNVKRRAIGKKAEDRTVKWERARVFKLGKYLDVSKIRRVSDDKKKGIGMGYDIDSFNGDKYTEECDRFIEVKGTSGEEPEIFWSENEIKKASDLGKQYWLYIWINVGKQDEKLLHRIQNPYKQIWENDKMKSSITPKTTYMINLKNWEELTNES